MTMKPGPSDRYREENREEWRVKFEIWSDALSRDEIDARLGTRSHGGFSRGEPRPRREHEGRLISPGGKPYESTLWYLISSPYPGEHGGTVDIHRPVDEHLACLFTAVEPLREALIAMSDETDARYWLVLIPHFDLDFSWNPQFLIPRDWTALLGALGGQISLDMYVFWGDEE